VRLDYTSLPRGNVIDCEYDAAGCLGTDVYSYDENGPEGTSSASAHSWYARAETEAR